MRIFVASPISARFARGSGRRCSRIIRRSTRRGYTLLVRQLPPGAQGVPIEVYCFTKDTAWVAYEDIQADLFDRILAMVPEFGLRVYQEPAGSDLAGLAGERGGEA